jgi:hypothetical protein
VQIAMISQNKVGIVIAWLKSWLGSPILSIIKLLPKQTTKPSSERQFSAINAVSPWGRSLYAQHQ